MAKRKSDIELKNDQEQIYKKLKNEESCLSGDKQEESLIKVVTQSRLTERDVGITEYIGKHDGFFGIIKHRFSDFLVNEIDKEGNVIRLNDITEPKDEENLCLPQPEEILSSEIIAKLKQLDEGDNVETVAIEVGQKSKEERRIIHALISKMNANFDTSTEDINAEKFIVVSKTSKSNNNEASNKFKKGVRQSWPSTRGNYTNFVIYKENIDTMECVNLIARFLGMKPGVFTYAGVKDRRAQTVQQMTVYRTEAHKLLNLNRRLRNIVIGNIKYVKQPLRLGDLWGNRFNIVLRDVKGTDENISKAMKSIEENGFLNYYGMQRFGTTTVPTYKIGLALLKGDWVNAIDLILQPRADEDENMTFCRNLWKNKEDPKKILSEMKKKNSAEANLLRGLIKHGTKDMVNALNSIPRNVRLMYVHSYQSYVWNRVLSKRYQLSGMNVMEGDLYLEKTEDEEIEVEEERQHPKYITSSDNEISLENIVLPLFGHDVLYPKNEIGKLYKEYLEADGLDINDLKRKIKDYSLPGAYRSIVVKPRNVEWSFVNYEDPTIALIQNDLSKMRNEALSDNRGGSLKAMLLQFDLIRSSYATMALRDIMRIDSSSAFQKTLNETR